MWLHAYRVARGFIIVVALLVGGCTYTGPHGPYDYTMAAGAGWVVSVSNDGWLAQNAAQPSNYGGNTTGRANDGPGGLGCGTYESYDPYVVYDSQSDRFVYTMVTQSGYICLSSAPGANPLVLDRAYLLHRDLFGGEVDFPQLAVSTNKIAITNYRPSPGHGDMVTRVFNKWDFLDNTTMRSARIDHGPGVTLAGIVGFGSSIAWVRPQVDAMGIGLITGVPGIAGGVNTTSALVPGDGAPAYDWIPVQLPAPGTYITPLGHATLATSHALTRTAVDGDTGLTTLTRVNGGSQLSLVRFVTVAPVFNPQRAEHHRVNLPPGGATFSCESMAMDEDDRTLVSFTSGGPGLWPHGFVFAKLRNEPPSAPSAIAPDATFSGTLRQDYCPRGAWWRASGQQWIGVGLAFPNGPGQLGGHGGRFGLFCQRKGGTVCTGP